MKAVLDHVGIAVQNVESALAFYRDALGLEVHGTEEVLSQRVRAHFIPAGGPALELLEGTEPESVITKYVERRGPGLHHMGRGWSIRCRAPAPKAPWSLSSIRRRRKACSSS
jgi:methylmalonyl-CoA/ethylmalonyl-CoA epimerase